MGRTRSLPFFLGLSCISFNALALEPAATKMGMFEVIPTLSLEERYDDNIYSQPDAEEDSWVTVLSPAVQANADLGTVGLQLNYQHIAGFYETSSDDNYSDNSFSGLLSWELNHRNQIELTASYVDGHEDRGSGFSQGASALSIEEPDTYKEQGLDARYIFGSEESKGRLVFALGTLEKEFTNHRDTTRGRDRDDNKAGVTFFWKVGGRTDLIAEVRHTDIDYHSDPAAVTGAFDTLDSDAQKYLVGVSWEATGKTQGSIKVGRAEKNFDDADRDDFSGSSWEIDLQWLPKTYSVVSFTSGQEARESNGTGSFIDEESYSLSWQHEWSDRVRSMVYYSFVNEVYDGDVAGREDDLNAYGLRVDYSMRRWLELGISANIQDKDSNSDAFDFDRSQVALHVTMSL